MKRLYFIFILLFSTTYLSAQDYTNDSVAVVEEATNYDLRPSVVGIEMGSTYEDTEYLLEKRYGRKVI